MKKLLLLFFFSSFLLFCNAQTYITEAPQGGFDVDNGKDYIVLYAPEDVIQKMGSKILTDNNLDPNQVDNELQYWVTDWDKKDLTIYNVPAEEGELNSFGSEEFINATPFYEWGTGVFVPKAKAYDLSRITDDHYLHIGLRDFGSSPSNYQFAIGSQTTIKNNGFQIMVGSELGQTSGDYVSIGKMPNGNDGKWYYIDIPVKDLVDPVGEFGFVYDFSALISDGVFSFSFYKPTCSTAKKSGPAPGESVYTYEITQLGSALSIDHVFFYVPDDAGVDGVAVDGDEEVLAVYDLMGRPVDNSVNGLYIVKTNHGVKKMIMR